jgi:predicted lipoprotein
MKLEDAIDLLHSIYVVPSNPSELPTDDQPIADKVHPVVLRSAAIPWSLQGPVFNAWMVLKDEADRRTGRNLTDSADQSS